MIMCNTGEKFFVLIQPLIIVDHWIVPFINLFPGPAGQLTKSNLLICFQVQQVN